MRNRRARVAEEIRAELARQKKTQASLCLATGMNKNTLHARLIGLRPFYLDELEAISSFLGVPLIALLERTEVPRG